MNPISLPATEGLHGKRLIASCGGVKI